MLKRKIYTFVILACLISSSFSFSPSVFAEENSQVVQSEEVAASEQVGFSQVIDTLDTYVNADNNQFEVASIPESIKEEIGEENINLMLEGIENLNDQALDGEITITDNGTVFENSDDEYVVQGGNVNKTVKHWWGKELYMSKTRTKDYIHGLNQMKITAVATGSVAALAPVSWMYAGVAFGAGGYLELMSNSLSYYNGKTSRGTVLSLLWSPGYKVRSQ
ncbi:hypothetical protein P4601_24265 [Peribacillus frigoritolerans]|uniref:hypothetical protein n=1 Tax=Peribacillus frigoritolerans TaxID=450367 RepID=UPI002E1B1714|nr:hypothetical protein [Peribacillus frigoritolerans]